MIQQCKRHDEGMNEKPALRSRRFEDATTDLRMHSREPLPLEPDATRLAYADPEFLARDDTRGIRLQLELLKADLDQAAFGIENTVVVFGSARFTSPEKALERLAEAEASGDTEAVQVARRDVENARHYEQAEAFARLVAEWSAEQPASDRIYICTGGGPGIMEAANRGSAHVGMPSVGLSVTLPFEEKANEYVTPDLSFTFHYFAMRKMHFMMRAKAMVVFPGGFGTMDELFEVLTLVQTGKSKPMPIVLFDSDYWGSLLNFPGMVEKGVISAGDLALFRMADEPQQAWDMIRGYYRL